MRGRGGGFNCILWSVPWTRFFFQARHASSLPESALLRGARTPVAGETKHGRTIARAAMTSVKSFACAMCGAPATMTCGGCAGFAYCAEACLRSHWTSGHAEACARVERDVAATAAVRAAHDVEALAWWRVAVVHVDEGLATACDALGECHGVGAFRRECGCFRREPFGTLPESAAAHRDETFEDTTNASGGQHRTATGAETHAPKTTPHDPLDLACVPAKTWSEMYARLGAPPTSRAAMVFSAAATTARFAERILLARARDPPRERIRFPARAARDVSDVASKQKLVIHLLGAEKELDQASAFARFLSRAWRGAPFRSLVPRDVEVHFVGPEVPEGWRPVAFRGGGDGDDSADAPSVAVYGHRGLYHRAVAEAAVPRARAGDASTNDAARRRLFLATAPDLVVCPDAGIAAFASWVPTVDLVLRMNVPALVTDLTAEAARMAAAVWRRRAAECIECVASRGAPIETDADVALNPFRRVLSARGNDTTAPTYANGFGFAWVPGEGVAPL